MSILYNLYIFSYIKPQLRFTCRCSSTSCISLYSYIKPQLTSGRPYSSFVVYPYIPTSNHNYEKNNYFCGVLYIPIFLHQTTTVMLAWNPIICCISLYSYIKPQRASFQRQVNQLYIPIFLHQTTTQKAISSLKVLLYIPIFLHQTTTIVRLLKLARMLYIPIFLHQTTTIWS